MVRSKFLVRLPVTLSMAIVVALAFSAFAVTDVGAQASAGKPTLRFFHFHGSYSDAALAHSGLTHWSASFSSEGQVWKYSMVGTNPKAGSQTTTIANTIVPMIMKFSDGTVFDGTKKVRTTTNSPLYKKAPFTSGTTQYGDAIQRAEFWDIVSANSPNYHVLLANPTIAPAVTITIPAAAGATAADPSTGKTIGIVDINYWDPFIQTLLTSMHFTANMLPIFLSNNVYLSVGAPNLNNCCVGGYHNAVLNQAGMQTYIWTAETDEGILGGFSNDVNALSHETAEWFNDPFTNNVVPNWTSPIAPQYGCNNFLEVGDPLVGVVFTVKGFRGDHLQDEAFFSWFARQNNSIAINDLYSYLGTLTTLSAMC